MAKFFENEMVKAVATGLVSTVVPMIVEQTVKDYQSYQKYLKDKRAAEEKRFTILNDEVSRLSKELKMVKRSNGVITTADSLIKEKMERECKRSPITEKEVGHYQRSIEQQTKRVDKIDAEIQRLIAEREYRTKSIANKMDKLTAAKNAELE